MFEWTDPDNIQPYDDLKGYVRVFHNAGNPDKPYPDYENLIDSVLAGVQTWESGPLADGVWAWGFRVFDGINLELNTETFAIFRVLNGELLAAFPTAPVLLADPAPAGTVSLMAMLDGYGPLSIPSSVKFYTNDGAGGDVDYSTAIATVSVTSQGNKYLAVSITGAYAETERKFGAVAYDSSGRPSIRAQEVSVTPDSTIPEAVPSVEITETRV